MTQTPIIPPPLPAADGGPLDEARMAQLHHAAAARKAVVSAARKAKISAVITLVIGILGVLCVGLYPSWDGVMIVVGICAVGMVELVGARLLREARPTAPKILGTNQLAFLAIIAIYCIIQMASFSPQKFLQKNISPEFRDVMQQMPGLSNTINDDTTRWVPIFVYGFYGLVLFLSILMQGGMALYYFTRRKRLDAYLAEPDWTRRVLAVDMSA